MADDGPKPPRGDAISKFVAAGIVGALILSWRKRQALVPLNFHQLQVRSLESVHLLGRTARA